MPVQFSRIKIAGFKSFAEPAVVEILPGLTGIVGPNGCGKSNVVEALRWAMGESSAKSLRGGEMDDVIFAGTTARPARNIAEVTLSLDETRGTAPPPFHEAAELEISRKIERGNGSVYRINGKEARARDVQTLFNDLATGAHSSGLVSQGRVGTLVNAKPQERRVLLEEAAGITGLHARRHEAELKLRAAEANLERAEDLRGQLEAQLEGLKRQARQANRYRAISGLVRQAEAELLALQRARAEATRASAGASLHAAQAAVTDLVVRATNLAMGFGDRLLFENVEFNLPRGGIVGVIGGNGSGKTTLFKLMTGQLQPLTGSLTVGSTVVVSHVDQSRESLKAENTVYEEITGGAENVDLAGRQMNGRAYCSRFNFKGADQQKRVGDLSGGERNRVHLAKLLRSGGNLLLLDEPSNDLDVATLRSLEEAITSFAGCAMVVSHDRWFLDRIATHILAFEGEGVVRWFEGNYQDYHENRRKLLGDAADRPTRVRFRPIHH